MIASVTIQLFQIELNINDSQNKGVGFKTYLSREPTLQLGLPPSMISSHQQWSSSEILSMLELKRRAQSCHGHHCFQTPK